MKELTIKLAKTREGKEIEKKRYSGKKKIKGGYKNSPTL
jgi:hypothetical protein